MKYQTNPLPVEAVQINAVVGVGERFLVWPFSEKPDWLLTAIFTADVRPEVTTMKNHVWRVGPHMAKTGDWIVRSDIGELSVFWPANFEKTFAAVPA